MDLCLPDDWERRAAEVFRDDIGPPAKPSPATGFICGLRDWHAVAKPHTVPLRGSKVAPKAPKLRPYRAPGWLIAMQPS